MAQATLEEVTRLGEQLTDEEQQALVKHLSRRLQPTDSKEPTVGLSLPTNRPPRSLRGIWAGHFPDDFDVDAVLHEIRHEWEKEWPEVFER